jgi:ComF family protein
MDSSLRWLANLGLFQQQSCIICQQNSRALICQYCKEDLPLFDLLLCQYNLLNIPRVKSGLTNVEFTHLLALADYQWPLAKLLRDLKFSAKLQYSRALAELFVAHCLLGNRAHPQAILPIPLHSSRYIRRKYNQSIEITKHISKLSGIPLDLSVLMRHKPTSAQSVLSGAKRRTNLRDAFTLMTPTNYTHIALFDDVLTTGATMQSVYQLLKKNYPQMQIDIWTICLTLVHPQNPP